MSKYFNSLKTSLRKLSSVDGDSPRFSVNERRALNRYIHDLECRSTVGKLIFEGRETIVGLVVDFQNFDEGEYQHGLIREAIRIL